MQSIKSLVVKIDTSVVYVFGLCYNKADKSLFHSQIVAPAFVSMVLCSSRRKNFFKFGSKWNIRIVALVFKPSTSISTLFGRKTNLPNIIYILFLLVMRPLNGISSAFPLQTYNPKVGCKIVLQWHSTQSKHIDFTANFNIRCINSHFCGYKLIFHQQSSQFYVPYESILSPVSILSLCQHTFSHH